MNEELLFSLRGAVIALLALVLVNIVIVVIRQYRMNKMSMDDPVVTPVKWVIVLASAVLLILGALAWGLVDGLDNKTIPSMATIMRYCMYGVGNFLLLMILFVGGRAQQTRMRAYMKFQQMKTDGEL